MRTALQDAGVRPSGLDRVLLVGGSTRIPRVAAVLAERLGQEPHGEVDPDLCVALGAGVQAGIEMGQDMQAVLVDITPYTFGTSAAGELYGMPYAHEFVPLIRRNSKLPATRTEVFFTMFEDQEEAEIKVYQGEDPDALKNVEIGTFLFKDLNRRQGAHAQGLLFTYSLDLDGLLHVHARERATGREIRGVVENAIGRSSDEALGAARERVGGAVGRGGTRRTQRKPTMRRPATARNPRRRPPCPRTWPGTGERDESSRLMVEADLLEGALPAYPQPRNRRIPAGTGAPEGVTAIGQGISRAFIRASTASMILSTPFCSCVLVSRGCLSLSVFVGVAPRRPSAEPPRPIDDAFPRRSSLSCARAVSVAAVFTSGFRRDRQPSEPCPGAPSRCVP